MPKSSGSALRFHFAAGRPDRSLQLECIADRSEFGEIIGLEILSIGWAFGLRGRLKMPRLTEGATVRLAYDAEADALSLSIAPGRSVRQEVCQAVVTVDQSGTLRALELLEGQG